VTGLSGKKSGKVLFIPGLLGLLVGLAGLVAAYSYAWVVTAPGLPDAAKARYELMGNIVGPISLGVTGVADLDRFRNPTRV
jgi:hypothetical protein